MQGTKEKVEQGRLYGKRGLKREMEQLIIEMYEAIDKFGVGSKEALEASQRLDIAVAREQNRIYTEYKATNLH